MVQTGEQQEIENIHGAGHQSAAGRKGEVRGRDEREKGEASGHLKQQYGAGLVSDADAPGGDGEQRPHRGGENAERDAGPVPGVEMEDQGHAEHRDDAEAQLADGRGFPVQQRIENSGEKTDGGETDHADGHVGVLDAAVKEYPVRGDERAHAAYFERLAQGDARQLSLEQEVGGEKRGGEQHPPPHERAFRQQDELAENAREPGDKNGEMQFDERVAHGRASEKRDQQAINASSAVVKAKHPDRDIHESDARHRLARRGETAVFPRTPRVFFRFPC